MSPCPYCEKIFKEYKFLSKHINTKHEDEMKKLFEIEQPKVIYVPKFI